MRIKHLLLLSILLIARNVSAQFVSIESRSFKLDGQDFYPVVLNYSVSLVDAPDGNSQTRNYFLSPELIDRYGNWTVCNNQNECDDRFLLELAKIRSMGFNTIRIGIAPRYRYDYDDNTYKFSAVGFDPNYSQSEIESWESVLDLDITNNNALETQLFLSLITHMLDLANASDIKVILICAGGSKMRHDSQGNNFIGNTEVSITPAINLSAVSAYSQYLSALAGHINNHPALLGYDLWNEPLWSEMQKQLVTLPTSTTPGIYSDWTKQEICGFVTQWYDALKTNDPNHLVTIGGSGPVEIFSFDEGMMKLDFYSIHTYPAASKYDGGGSYNIENGVLRCLGELYWLGKVSNKPWIIGETGFSADDATVEPGGQTNYLDNNPSNHLPPYMYGSEAQQADFAQRSLEATRNYGGWGYSWWVFQNAYWGGPFIEQDPDDVHSSQNYFGLLGYYIDPVNSVWREKDAVSIFENYPQPPDEPVTTVSPENYYNPYEWTATFPSRFVKDQNGLPIENAVMYYSVGALGPQGFISKSEIIFSNAQGEFILHKPSISGYDFEENNISNVLVSYPNSSIAHNQNNNTYLLNKYDFDFQSAVQNEIVDFGDVRVFANTWSSLTVENTEVVGNGSSGGYSEFTARDHIKLLPGFSAKAGSTTKVYLSSQFPDCNNSAFYKFDPNEESESQTNSDEQNIREFVLRFNTEDNFTCNLYPNPAKEQFRIDCGNTDRIFELVIYNSVGQIVKRSKTYTAGVSVICSDLSSGIYYAQINSEEKTQRFKLIKQ